jgi:type VI secretion system protein
MNFWQTSAFMKRYALLLFGIAFLCGCQSNDQETYPDINLESVSIVLDADANENSATAVDVLMVYDKSLLRSLMSMSSRKYYANLNQIRRDYPEMVDIYHWELTPGQFIYNYPVTMRSDTPFGAVVFADYYTPGDHRIRIGSEEHINVQLKRLDFCVIEQGCASDLAGRTGFSEAINESLKDGMPHQIVTIEEIISCEPKGH